MNQIARLAPALGLAMLISPAAGAGPASPFPSGYEAAYRAYIAALPPSARALPWLTRLNGVASQPQPLSLGGTNTIYLFACANHQCDTNNANIFLLPDRKQVRAVVKIRGVRIPTGGAGPQELACVAKLDANGGVASAC